MIIEKSVNLRYLSNSYLVADRAGGRAVIIDSGAPPEPLLRCIKDLQLRVEAVLCTHHHIDHVEHNDFYRSELQCAICGHEAESGLFASIDRELKANEVLSFGGLEIVALHIPGHTLGQLAFLINGERVFTGDTLFQGSVGGTRGPGHTSYEDLERSVMSVLMALGPETKVYPGHSGETSIGREWQENPFVRFWRGIDKPAERDCEALGAPARLLLRARDYDGGNKCLVRFLDSDRLDLVPGSRVQDLSGPGGAGGPPGQN